jgi:chemotaxis protein CheX
VNTKTVVLPSVLDLKAAAPLTENLLSLRGNDLVLDGSQVERLGGQCLQVLVSATLSWHAEGMAFEISKPSEAFVDGLAALGVRFDDLCCLGQVAMDAQGSAA